MPRCDGQVDLRCRPRGEVLPRMPLPTPPPSFWGFGVSSRASGCGGSPTAAHHCRDGAGAACTARAVGDSRRHRRASLSLRSRASGDHFRKGFYAFPWAFTLSVIFLKAIFVPINKIHRKYVHLFWPKNKRPKNKTRFSVPKTKKKFGRSLLITVLGDPSHSF